MPSGEDNGLIDERPSNMLGLCQEVRMSRQMITLPRQVVVKVLLASNAVVAFQDELEDYLIGHQPALLKKLRQARREHLAGKTRPFTFPA